jgi:hypothetical protein
MFPRTNSTGVPLAADELAKPIEPMPLCLSQKLGAMMHEPAICEPVQYDPVQYEPVLCEPVIEETNQFHGRFTLPAVDSTFRLSQKEKDVAVIASGEISSSGPNSDLPCAATKLNTFIKKIIGEHLNKFISAGQLPQQKQDLNQINDAAKKLHASVKLLRHPSMQSGDAEIVEVLEQVSLACLFYAGSPPVMALQEGMDLITDQRESETKNDHRLGITNKSITWHKQSAAHVQYLRSAASRAAGLPFAPLNFASQLNALAGVGMRQVCWLSEFDLVTLEKLLQFQRTASTITKEQFEKMHSVIPTKGRTKVFVSDLKTMQSTSPTLVEEVNNYTNFIASEQTLIFDDAVDSESNERLLTAKENALLQCRLLTFEAGMVELERAITRLRKAKDPLTNDLFQTASRLKQVATYFVGIDLECSDQHYLTGPHRNKIVQSVIDHAAEQSYVVEIEIRRLIAQLEADSRARVQHHLHADLIATLNQVADYFSALVVWSNFERMGLTISKQSAVAVAVTANSQESVKKFKNKYLKTFLEDDNTDQLRSAQITHDHTNRGATPIDSDSERDALFGWIQSIPVESRGAESTMSQQRIQNSGDALATVNSSASNPVASIFKRLDQEVNPALQEARNRADHALDYAECQLVFASEEVANPGQFPNSASKVKQTVYQACDCLELSADLIKQTLSILADAKRDIAALDSSPDNTSVKYQEILQHEKSAKSLYDRLNSRALELHTEADILGRAQTVNCFLKYPTYDNYRRLTMDDLVSIAVRQTCSKKLLPSTKGSDYAQPTSTYLDVYVLRIASQCSHLKLSDEPHWVELHLHYDNQDSAAEPTCAYLKNQHQALHNSAYGYRGRIPSGDLLAMTNDVIARVGQSK